MDKIIIPNPLHVLMPSMVELEDADQAARVGRWTKKDCLVCSGKGSYIGYSVAEPGVIGEFLCDCEEQLVLHRWMAVRGIPNWGQQLRWVDMSGAHPDWTDQAIEYLRQHEANMRVGLGMLFHGRSGSGKSSLAWLIMKSLLFAEYDCYAFNASKLPEYLYRWRNDQDRLDRWNRRVMRAKLLLIDDLGKEVGGNTKTVEDSVDRIISLRAENRMATIITSNLDPEQLGVKYTSTMELLRGSGLFLSMSLPESWRETDLMARNRFEVANNIARPTVWG